MGVRPLPKIPRTPLDLAFKVGDKVRHKQYRWATSRAWSERTVEGFNIDGDMLVGGSTGPKYTDKVTGELVTNADGWEFACHNPGAPFESTTLHEQESYDDGYRDGFHICLVQKPYMAGGPYVGKGDSQDCRHLQQCHEYERRNNAAFLKGWKAGMERAIMKKIVDFTKPIQIVKDTLGRTPFVIGETSPQSGMFMVNIGSGNPPGFDDTNIVIVDQYGAAQNWSAAGYGLVFENAPEYKTVRRTAAVKIGEIVHNIVLSVTTFGDELNEVTWVNEP